MPQDDFPDLLQYIPKEIRDLASNAAGDLADAVDQQTTIIAEYIKEALKERSWDLPSMRAGPLAIYEPPPPPPPTLLQKCERWASSNSALVAACVAFVGTGAFVLMRRRRYYSAKRRARRVAGGTRVEVVMLIGSPYSPLTISVALDLERRGFIVFIPVTTKSEEDSVKGQLRADIRPIRLDITNSHATESTLWSFTNTLQNSTLKQGLRFASIIMLPPYPSPYPVSPLTNITPSTWSLAFNTHLLYPFSIAQAFLPLLMRSSTDYHRRRPITNPSRFRSTLEKYLPVFFPTNKAFPTSIIALTPSLKPALSSPNHAVENITHAAISSWLSTLRSELSTSKASSVRVTQIQMGTFNPESITTSNNRTALVASRRSGSSPSSSPASRGRNLLSQRRSEGSPLRDLHIGLFDAITGENGGARETLYLGRHSFLYAMMGSILSRGLVGWMLFPSTSSSSSRNHPSDSSSLSSSTKAGSGSMRVPSHLEESGLSSNWESEEGEDGMVPRTPSSESQEDGAGAGVNGANGSWEELNGSGLTAGIGDRGNVWAREGGVRSADEAGVERIV
ncbi:hypothetical protein MMC25_004601 [Agyrium rufum]|nr:hypothetical protein [Agyrium rufum]